jgi:gliding motility-associated-like protein
MQKTVSPEVTTPCSDVLYVFHIANGSQSRQIDIELEDFLPDGFVIEEIVYNPFMSRVVEGVGSNHLLIDQIEIPSGQDSIVIRVNVGNNPPGTYGNLAHLNNLPENLGVSRLSDNPQTLRNDAHDSTYVTIEPPVFSFEEVDGICAGDSIVLKASLPGADYLWQDGSTDSFLLVVSPGLYSVTATTACDTYMASTAIEEESISVDFVPQSIEVSLGDIIVLEPVINNSGMELVFDWKAPDENSLSCLDCENPSVRPLTNTQYDLRVINEYGCEALSTLNVNVIINRDVYVANIFSPNNDNVNDFFYIQSAGSLNIKYFRIYDRGGNKVYESNDSLSNNPSAGWDGYFKGKIMDNGVYVWTAVIEFLDGPETQHSGSVTLVR